MEHVGVRQFKDHLSAYLERVARGESLVVTDRGRPLARVVPVSAPLPAVLTEALREGRVAWSGRKPVLPKNPPPGSGPGTVAELVVEDRR